MKFNDKLLDLRKKKGWSQEELGNELNVSRQTVSKWEAGQTTPELEKLKKLSEIFGITVDSLIDDSDTYEEKVIEVSNKNDINQNEKNSKKRVILKIVILLIISIITIYLLIVIKRCVILYEVFEVFQNEQKNISEMIVNKTEVTDDNTTISESVIRNYYKFTDGEHSKIYIREDIGADDKENKIYAIYQDSDYEEKIKIDVLNKTYEEFSENKRDYWFELQASNIYMGFIRYYEGVFSSLGNTLKIASDLSIRIYEVDNDAMKGYYISDAVNSYNNRCDLKIDTQNKVMEFYRVIYENKKDYESVNYIYKYDQNVSAEQVSLPNLEEYTKIEK